MSKTQKYYEYAELELPVSNYMLTPQTDSKHPLEDVFDKCLEQVISGKGNDRHGNGKYFLDQPWRHIADVHGDGFLTGQAQKKLMEAQGFEDKDRWEREMFGVIVYSAMAILYRRKNEIK